MRPTVVVLSLAPTFAYSSVAQTEPGHQTRSLFIASYHPTFRLYEHQFRGLIEGLAERGLKRGQCVLDVEFLDGKRFPVAERTVLFGAALGSERRKYPEAGIKAFVGKPVYRREL